MAGETTLTIVGNLTADPELRFTPAGVAVASFTVASTPRTYDRKSGEWRDGETLFMRCSVWRDVAENVAESLRKGTRVIVSGRLESHSYKTREGENRTSMELQVDEVGPSLRYAKAQVERNPRESGANSYNGANNGGQRNGNSYSGSQNYGNSGFSAPAGGQSDDPWAGTTSFDDEPPF